MIQIYTKNLGYISNFVSTTYLITWTYIKMKDKLVLSLIKYLNYVTKDNICQLIFQLIEKAKKTKVILECSYSFGKRVDGVILINFSTHKNQKNFIPIFVGVTNSITTTKNKIKNPNKRSL